MRTCLFQSLFGIDFKNPVIAASGTFGFGEEFQDYYDVSLLGGFVTKAVTPEPRTGNPPPRIIETPSGMLNAIGLQNPGLTVFVESILPRIARLDTVIIVNVAGRTVADYMKVCSELDRHEAVRALEINISCPNVKQGGVAFGTSPQIASQLIEAVRTCTDKPIIAKLTPNVTDIAEIACAVEEKGADAVSLINTITGMVIDVETRQPMLANGTGGLSGPAIRPVAVRMVYQVARAVSVPVIGMGGIFCARDALEFIIAGASLVEVGCGMFVEPDLPLRVIDGIGSYCERHGVTTISDIIGSLTVPGG
ncbi:dihydroorotate dehydrogenase [bacterium]|nr:dihydroorotate dehydrogenase [bacterium]